MDFSDAVRGRRSIRAYQPRDVPATEIEELIDLARYAPSSMNGQPWHFVVVRDAGIKRRLADIKNRFCPAAKQVYRADFLVQAPVILVLCVDRLRSYGREFENGMLASSIILIGAHSRGLGSAFLTAFNRNEPGLAEEIKQALDIPQGIEPVAILPVGYPDEFPGAKALRPLTELVHDERF